MSRTRRPSVVVSSLALVAALLFSASVQAQDCERVSQIVPSPAAVDFGNVGFGDTATLPLTLTNASGFPVRVDAVRTAPHAYFATTEGDCLRTLADGESCTLEASFTPASVCDAVCRGNGLPPQPRRYQRQPERFLWQLHRW